MSVTAIEPRVEEVDPHLVLNGIPWEQYVAINDALPERRGLRMTYIDGSLTLLTGSRRHDWFADSMDSIIKAVGVGCELDMEIAGSATFRLEGEKVGVEGDRTYYFGEHAAIMRGPIDIDRATQPPPDLAIEVEYPHPAHKAVATYARMGVPEVWRYDVRKGKMAFLALGQDGAYEPVERSRNLPLLKPEDVLFQLKLVDEIGPFPRWSIQLHVHRLDLRRTHRLLRRGSMVDPRSFRRETLCVDRPQGHHLDSPKTFERH